MKLVSFLAEGRTSYGIVEGPDVLDIGAILWHQYPALKLLLGDSVLEIARQASGRAARLRLADCELLPPVTNPEKILCVGKNYEEHRVEMGGEKTEYPTIFVRFADTQIGHDGEAWIPVASTKVDYEGELAVIIGRGGRRIKGERALEHVGGYSCYNDISIRDWQRHTGQFTPGKNFPRTGGFGPWMVTADEVPDPQTLELTTRLNGEVVQQANTAEMIFSVRKLIEYCSAFTALSPGDVIITGTPGGVGVKRTPPLFLKVDDVVEVEIGKIGVLRNKLVNEPE